ncbi:MAG: hypothetical protein C0616_09425 [Desulfuromonas sp.]|nr:MAG: hypothetical protein C0616_09425 [Desulfuromonas sp.]
MRILAFNHSASLYGAQKSLLTLLGGLKGRGHHIMILSPTDGPAVQDAKARGLETAIVHFPLPKLGSKNILEFSALTYRSSKTILLATESFQPDVIIFNTVACLSPAIALRQLPIRKIWSLRETTPMRGLVSMAVASLSDLAVANCHYIAAQYPVLQRKMHLKTVVNGIASGEESPCQEGRVEHRKAGRKKALFAGSLVTHKGVHTLLQGAKIALEKECDFELDIFGDGILQSEMDLFIKKHGLSDRVRLKGFISNLGDSLAEADVVVIPSLIEPFPRIGLEAMALGKPIVGSAVGGIMEQVVDGFTGFLFKPGNADDLAEKLIRLLSREDLIKRLGEQGRSRQSTLFSEQAYIDNYERYLSPGEIGDSNLITTGNPPKK